VRHLAARGIATSVHFIPLNLLTAYQRELEWRPGDMPEAERQFPHLLSLPIWPRMEDRDVHAVIDAVLDVVGRYRPRRPAGARRMTSSNRESEKQ
jgi:dTDP-4-amino-4,6-dideoxygalactose transaminase